jgi:hypothetical protein
MSDNYLNQVSETEIAIKNIINFLLEPWKAIVATCVAGFIAVTPSQFEAAVQIQINRTAVLINRKSS